MQRAIREPLTKEQEREIAADMAKMHPFYVPGNDKCTCGHDPDEHDFQSGWCSHIIRWHSNETTYDQCLCEKYTKAV